jgi:hypothetical protein
VSARPGGETDKFGSMYEGAWTIHHLLLVLSGGADAITVEDVGEIAQGAEFTLLRNATTEVHQVKVKYRNANGWSPKNLQAENVLENARHHVQLGRQFHFISSIPAPTLTSLSDRARRAASLKSFATDWMTEGLRPDWDYLVAKVTSSDQAAWQLLRGMWMHCLGEADIRHTNDALAGLLLDGAPPTLAALGLGDLAQHNLGVRLDAAAIKALLEQYGLRLAHRIGSPDVARTVAATLASWQASIERELLQPVIHRTEGAKLAETLRSGVSQVAVVVGTAGAGKSAVLHQGVQALEAENWAILGVRLDRLEGFASTAEIGQRLGLGMSPVAALAAAANERPSLLIIDQLDAVSLASGRMPHSFDAVADLIREAAIFPQMRVLLACRAFDVDNDHRIRQLITDERVTRVEVHPLTDSQVDAAVTAMNLPASKLTAVQRSLLSLPLNLVLLHAIADQPDALAFTSATGLLNAYWERKHRDCTGRRQPEARFTKVITVLANAMSARQQLSAPITVLDADELAADADVLASEHVLVRDGRRYAFFHEAFFDYAFARLWINRDQDLVTFLLADEQELFRRAQVRQILQHIRDDDPARFIREVEAVLAHPGIRFHIKVVVLALLRSLTDPSPAEWEMIERLMAAEGPVTAQLWTTIRTLPWFERLDAEGALERWLASGDDTVRRHALEVMLGAVKERPDRLAALLAPYAGERNQYLGWLMWVTRFANVHESRALFDLMLEAVRRGDLNGADRALWDNVYGLGQQQPGWAVELLVAWLVERPGALDLEPSGKVAALSAREHSLVELVSNASSGAPLAYCQQIIPYLLRVMSLTESNPAQRPVADRHFSHRLPDAGPARDLDDALLHGAAAALRSLVMQEPDAIQPLLEELARDPHDSAQWLLYEALRAAGERYADWAAELLLEGEHRFHSGYLSDSHWTTRQLLEATTPHMSVEHLRSLETAVMAFRPSYESRQGAGRTSFELLSGMDETRLSDAAKRRLGELRRKFNTDQPSAPTGVTGGFIGPPIPQEAAKRMNDDQWLGAMRKHRTDRTDYAKLTGGVHEQSQVLRAEAVNDPTRFAKLALRLTPDIPAPYASVILEALGQTEESIEPTLVFDAMRHIATFNNSENDQALALALHRQLDSAVPDDIISLILHRALEAPDPTEELWSKQAPNGQYYLSGDIRTNGINTARGQAAATLGDLIVHDTDGHRTALVAPSLTQLAQDPSVAVRSCVAHLLTACLRHASTEAIAAYEHLLAADDRLLATQYVVQLAIYVGWQDATLVEPVVQRMLASSDEDVRKAGGLLAAYAGLEFGLPQLLTAARESADAAIRLGAADLCARSLPHTSDALAAAAALKQFVVDDDEEVRKAAAQLAAELRNRELRPFSEVLTTLIASKSFTEGLPQLLITLQAAPDRIDDMVIACTRRFIDVYGEAASDISTSAAGDAHQVAQLILRAYAQASDRDRRHQALDLIDGLLVINAMGALEAVDAAGR